MATALSSLVSTGLSPSSGSSSNGSSSGGSSTGGFTGLGQGINIQAFVSAAEAGATANISNVQDEQTGVNADTAALTAITTDLTALQSATSALQDPLGVLASETATSSNPNNLTAAATVAATPGTHTIAITSLATTSSYYSDPVATGSTPLATGDTISVSAGGSKFASVTVNSTNNTLNQIASAINAQGTYYTSGSVASGTTPLATGDTISISAGGATVANVSVDGTNNTLAGIAAAINTQTTAVHASIVNDANGVHLAIAPTPGGAGNLTVTGSLSLPDSTAINFSPVVAASASVITDANGARLAIVSGTSGTPGNLSVTGSLHQTGGAAVNFTQAVAGLNAVLTVDNVPISSTSNTVTGVINGVTLNLGGPTGTSPVSLTVGPDTTDATTAINAFVSAYNTAITDINSQFALNSTGAAEPLSSDLSLSDAQAQLLSAASYAIASTGGTQSLATLGISTNNDGTLTVDSGALGSALTSNFAGVQSFFQSPTSGFANTIATTLNNLIGGSGELTLDAQGYSNQNIDLTQQISDLQAALATQTTQLDATYAQVNTMLEELPLLQSQLSQQLTSIA